MSSDPKTPSGKVPLTALEVQVDCRSWSTAHDAPVDPATCTPAVFLKWYAALLRRLALIQDPGTSIPLEVREVEIPLLRRQLDRWDPQAMRPRGRAQRDNAHTVTLILQAASALCPTDSNNLDVYTLAAAMAALAEPPDQDIDTIALDAVTLGEAKVAQWKRAAREAEIGRDSAERRLKDLQLAIGRDRAELARLLAEAQRDSDQRRVALENALETIRKHHEGKGTV